VDYGWYSAGSGTQELCLEGTGPDFDLYLLKRGALGGWSVVASSLGPTSSESITYSGTSGYYLWYIRSYQGSGSWQLWVSYP
jgi:streptogrisin C